MLDFESQWLLKAQRWFPASVVLLSKTFSLPLNPGAHRHW